MNLRIPRLAQAVLAVAGIYGAFKLVFGVLLGQPIPSSLLTMYMFFVVAGVFMVFTFTEESAREHGENLLRGGQRGDPAADGP